MLAAQGHSILAQMDKQKNLKYDRTDQDHHGNQAGWIKYLWIRKGMANCAYCFGPKASNGDEQSIRQFPLTKHSYWSFSTCFLCGWVSLQISQKYLCAGEQGRFIICRSSDFLTTGSKAINWKAISYNMRVPQGNQILCQQMKINTYFFLHTGNKLLKIMKKVPFTTKKYILKILLINLQTKRQLN